VLKFSNAIPFETDIRVCPQMARNGPPAMSAGRSLSGV